MAVEGGHGASKVSVEAKRESWNTWVPCGLLRCTLRGPLHTAGVFVWTSVGAKIVAVAVAVAVAGGI